MGWGCCALTSSWCTGQQSWPAPAAWQMVPGCMHAVATAIQVLAMATRYMLCAWNIGRHAAMKGMLSSLLLCMLFVLQVRDGVLYMLDAWIGVATADKVFPSVADAIANPKCIADGRITGLLWCVAGAWERLGCACGGGALMRCRLLDACHTPRWLLQGPLEHVCLMWPGTHPFV